MGQHCKGNFLAKCWSTQIKETWQITLQCKVVYGVVGQHYTGNFLVRCWHRQTQKYFLGYFLALLANIAKIIFCAILPQHGRYNILYIIFLIKVVCQPRASITQVKTLCNVVQEAPDNIALEEIMFNVVLIFLIILGQHRTGKSLKQFCLRGSSQQCMGKNLVQCCLNTI